MQAVAKDMKRPAAAAASAASAAAEAEVEPSVLFPALAAQVPYNC